MSQFDLFEIRQFANGWVLNVSISRPRNAARYRRTEADRRRSMQSARENSRLASVLFPTFQDLMTEIARLKFPESES